MPQIRMAWLEKDHDQTGHKYISIYAIAMYAIPAYAITINRVLPVLSRSDGPASQVRYGILTR